MILKYVTTRPTLSPEDLKAYSTELVNKFSRAGLDRVDILSIPVKSSTTTKEVAKAITSNKIVANLPPVEQAEFTQSFGKIFKGLHPDAPVLPSRTSEEGTETLSMVFMFINPERQSNLAL